MGFREIFKQMALRQDTSEQLMSQLADVYMQAAEKSRAGESLEEISLLNQQARSLLDAGANRAKTIENVVLPQVLKVLADNGIEEPSVEFLISVVDNIRQKEPESQTEVEVPQHKRKGRKSIDKEDRPLTDVQYLTSKARLRLIDEPRNGVRLSDAVMEIFPKGVTAEFDEKILLVRVAGNWNNLARKIQADFSRMEKIRGTEVILPLSEEELAMFDGEPLRREVYQRLNQIPAYQGMNLDELFEYTNTIKGVDLLTGENPVLDLVDNNQDIDTEINLDSPLKIFEAWYLATRLVKTNGLSWQDNRDIRHIMEKLEARGEFGASEVDWDRVKEELRLRTSIFINGKPEESDAIFSAQDEDVQLLFGAVQRYWRSGDLTERLDID